MSVYNPPTDVCVAMLEASIVQAQKIAYEARLNLAVLNVNEWADVEAMGARKVELERAQKNARSAIDVLYAELAALGKGE